ncbi:CopG family transcriptional regulator [Nocardiopsis gilva YIM 90087]|uniref:CopG family transcriptional regulator n=1 Tax=Nocardiopsis gilva YIM 90087 TaxID=1235441 RepID=A0A223S3T5_9ACTN|nr:CopG family transcriptional regulator [Nocardiopsis gilva]ASU82790.1 CopG family transcriptional regulator [Nocardiopsis gilva YIM 90087]
MAMKRLTVYVDSADLALIKESARRRGIAEAEIIRQGVHLAAMANRVWDEPLDWPMFDGRGETVSNPEVTAVVAEGTSCRADRLDAQDPPLPR